MRPHVHYSRGRADGHAKKGYVPMILEEEPKDPLLLSHPDGIKIVWMGEPVPVKYPPGHPRGLEARRDAKAKALKMARYHLGNL